MTIDRHNYEEFFILYLDNELSAQDRRQVEAFTQANPDLREELNLLLQSKFTPDEEIIMENKDAFLKPELGEKINQSNYEEWLLSYNDGELNRGEQNDVERLLAANPAMAEELSLFRKTKLEPDTSIIFPDKELLYRHETKVRVISFRKLRIAVAAALLIGLSTSVYMAVQNKKEQALNSDRIADSGKTNSATNSVTNPDNTVASVDTKNTELSNNNQIEVIGNQDSNETKATYPAPGVTISNRNYNLNANSIGAENHGNENPVAMNTPENSRNIVNSNVTTANPVAIPIDLNSAANPDALANALTIQKENNSPAVVTTSNTGSSEIETPETLTEDDLAGVNQSGKKNKFRGFFRKVTRTFEKTTNIKATDEEDRLLLAGLAIKL